MTDRLVKGLYTVPFQAPYTFETKDMTLALHQAWNQFVTQFAAEPQFVIMSEQAWLQLKVLDVATKQRMEVFGTQHPCTFRGKPLVVSQAAQVPLEMVGLPGSLLSLTLTWSDEVGEGV